MKFKLKNKNNIFYFAPAFVILVSLLWLAYPLSLGEPDNNKLYRVVDVYDGDTIVVLMEGQRESVRLIGIDTPEVESPYTREECYGKQASEFTKDLLLWQSVRLEPDPINDDRDKYERLLRYVYLNDTHINARLLTEGCAYLLDNFPFVRLDEFRALEQNAREQKAGLWTECEEK
ncbi:thermonuclease family protein [Candidatus Parcubacteria bacterium]|nr:thermonuclease family protein [Candidatus Parcubacteria bacterium]